MKRLMARELVGIGRRIEYLMCKGKMSERELAKKMKVSAATVSRYISGRRIPNVTNIIAICRIFNVSADWLLGMEVEKG